MQTIVIFNKGYELLGFVDVGFNFTPRSGIESSQIETMKDHISNLKGKKLHLRDGSEINPGEDNYLLALSEELAWLGYSTKIINSNIQSALIELYEKLPPEKFMEVSGEILNLDTDNETAEDLAILIQEITSR